MKATIKKSSYKRINVYLAYSITSNQSMSVSIWKDSVKKDLKRHFKKIHVLDPIRYGLDNSKDWREIIRRNSKDIFHADYIIAYLDAPSFGVMSEIELAHRVGVPIVGHSANTMHHQSPYIKRCIQAVAHDIQQIISFIEVCEDGCI